MEDIQHPNKELMKKARRLTHKLNSISDDKEDEKEKIIKDLFGTTGEKIKIANGFQCDYGFNIHVGENFFANYNLIILDCAEVRIGKNCLIGPQVGIYAVGHPIERKERIKGYDLVNPVTIGDDCWIGGNSVINPGVTLGNNVIVGSGSVVTKSFGDNVIIAGNPARMIRNIAEQN